MPRNDVSISRSHNSSRLSMALGDRPLMPFGMKSPRSIDITTCTRNPICSKLSLKSIRSPGKSSPAPYSEIKSRPLHFVRSQKAMSNKENNPPIDSMTPTAKIQQSHFNFHQKAPVNSALYEQDSDISLDNSVLSILHDSCFSEIEDGGNFVEFSHTENLPEQQKEKAHIPSDLYYTSLLEQDETVFSTSSKTPNARVGFHKFVECLKKHKAMKAISEEQESSVSSYHGNYLSEEIITGSRNVVPNPAIHLGNNRFEAPINSTLINPTENQQMFMLPDISTLTLNSEDMVHSSNLLLNKSNAKQVAVQSDHSNRDEYLTNNSNDMLPPRQLIRSTVVKDSETEDSLVICDESSHSCEAITSYNECRFQDSIEEMEEKSTEILNKSPLDSTNNESVNILAQKTEEKLSCVFARSNENQESQTTSSMRSGALKLVLSDISSENIDNSQVEDQVQCRKLISDTHEESPHECTSLLSSDNSTSDDSISNSLHSNGIGNKDETYKGLTKIGSPVQVISESSDEEFSGPELVKDPVAKWIMKSPFKEGSFDSSFLLKRDLSADLSVGYHQNYKARDDNDPHNSQDSICTIGRDAKSPDTDKQSVQDNAMNEISKNIVVAKDHKDTCLIIEETSSSENISLASGMEETGYDKFSGSDDSSSPVRIRRKPRSRKVAIYLDSDSSECESSGVRRKLTKKKFCKEKVIKSIKSPNSETVNKQELQSSKNLKFKLFSASKVNFDNNDNGRCNSTSKNTHRRLCQDKETGSNGTSKHTSVSNKDVLLDHDFETPLLERITLQSKVESGAKKKLVKSGTCTPNSQSINKIRNPTVKKKFTAIKSNEDKNVVISISSDSNDSFILPNVSPIRTNSKETNVNRIKSRYDPLHSTNDSNYKNNDGSHPFEESSIKSSTKTKNLKNVIESSDSDDVFELPNLSPPKTVKTPPSQKSLKKYNKNAFFNPKFNLNSKENREKVLAEARRIKKETMASKSLDSSSQLSLLSSLSATVNLAIAHPDAIHFVKNFKGEKGKMTTFLYDYYNEHVFENKLPSKMNITWNTRLTKSAGFCYYQLDKSKPTGRGARIELSNKVIDVPERLRDTLIHEMCHAAAWIISGYKDGHGLLWKAWTNKAMKTFPELPTIDRCHSYDVAHKYTYQCSNCSYSIGRHSKSLNTDIKVCGYCYGKFELIVNTNSVSSTPKTPGSASVLSKTPRTPNAFALFVKENYGSIKKSGNKNHAEVMKTLSTEFSKTKSKKKL